MMVCLFTLACAACSPLRDDGGCAKPCSLSCPGSCLATGYCSAETASLEAPLNSPYLNLAFGDLPPNSAVAIAFHLVVDLADRGNTLPWDYWIQVQREIPTTPTILDLAAFNTYAFPVVADWTGADTTDTSGNYNFDLDLSCGGRGIRASGPEGCLILPATTATVSVIDTTPWEDPPACP